ncbi:MAG: DUF3795 domain-containing protein [Clostridiaceae bacterium]|nr:DUF3795 domain-containing protein [Clostridiaceae bacterium]
MTAEELKNAVGPCSLMCYTCFGYRKGGVPHYASKLLELYKGWYSGHVKGYGDTPTEQQTEKLKRIKIFNEMLRELISQPNCSGCHTCGGEGGGCIPGCIIPGCAKNHHVDFCAQCPEFPCEKGIPEHIRKAWLDGSRYIQEHGLEEYFEEHKHIAHYIGCYDANIE